MLLVKTHVGDGAWGIFEADHDATYLGSQILIELKAEDLRKRDYTFWKDDRFPTDDCGQLHVFGIEEELQDDGDVKWDSVHVRWIKWRDVDGVGHMLVTPHPVFLCNDRGDTIEAIR